MSADAMSAENATRHMLTIAAALLERGRNIDRLSCGLTIAALIGLAAPAILDTEPPGPVAGALTIVALAGLAELALAIRVAFDAALFQQLAREPAPLNAPLDPAPPDLAGFDAALLRLKLLPAAKAGRPVEQRIAGARRLFHAQALTLLVQVAAVLGMVLLVRLRT